MAVDKPTRIALLVCDTPNPVVVAAHGEYPSIFTTLLRASLPQDVTPEAAFVLDAYDVVHKMEYPSDAAEYDAILLTGSAASAYENLEWINRLVAYVASVINSQPQVKVIGICFGHQIVGRALGAECVPNDGKWEVGVTPVQMSDEGKRIFGVDTLNIQQMHRDHVPTLPSSCRLLGSTATSYNQGMVRYADADPSSIQVLTLQGHPEFTTSIVNAIVEAREAVGVISHEIADDARARGEWRNDGVSVVGKVIWKVLGLKAAP
ncbi:hypothetical protein PLICRDRAFT_42374 [Plicaturopsis crispa FD-325 SS-3]|nr:hypothetical protein PLICRDRAFT_42374 [Plicaturopsis crispa FD-325 SS-3]